MRNKHILIFKLSIFLVLSTQVSCTEQQGRSCTSNEDCVNSAPKIYCSRIQGICVAQTTECTAGTVEECYDGPQGTAEHQPCRKGQRFCLQQGRWSACQGAVYPTYEICDRQDNDCNGKIDDVEGASEDESKPHPCQCYVPGSRRGCYGGPTNSLKDGKGQGLCSVGFQFCEADGKGKNWWARCYEQTLPSGESCDGLDNDCNGKIDDHPSCTCTPKETRNCFPGDPRYAGVGSCRRGIQTCAADGTWETTCKDAVLPQQQDSCGGGDEDCDGKVDEGCDCQGVLCGPKTCVSTETWSDQHCGACNNPCAPSQRCQRDPSCKADTIYCAFQCVCKDDSTLCDGGCVDLQNHTQHCGACGKRCGVGETCEKGVCKGGSETCPTGTERCGESCTNLQNSDQHCGACGRACKIGETCSLGACIPANPIHCQSDQKECGGVCVNLKENNQHCGACGKTCATGKDCVEGECRFACPSGETHCSNGCFALYQDPSHCGACGRACASGEVCNNSRCSAPWSLSVGGVGSEQLYDMKIDANGDIYLVGSYENNLALYNLTSKGGKDAFVIKLAPDQSLIWAKSIGDIGNDSAKSIALDQKGKLYITGSFEQTIQVDGKTIQSIGKQDVFWLEMETSTGAVNWLKQGGGPEDDEGESLAIDNNGNLYLTGTFQGKSDFGSKSTQADQFKDIFLLKTNKQGEALWLRKVSSPANNENPRVIVSHNQQPVLVGGIRALADVDGTKLSTQRVDIFVARWTAAGLLRWAKKAGGVEDDYVTGLIALRDDSVLLAGHFKQTATFGAHTLTAMGSNTDIYIAHMDASGNFSWAERFGDDGREEVGKMIESNGGLYLTGYYNGVSKLGGFSFPLNSGANDNNAFVAEFSGSKNTKASIIWAMGTGGMDLEQPTSLARYNNALYVGGIFEKKATLGSQSLTSQGARDIFLWRVFE